MREAPPKNQALDTHEKKEPNQLEEKLLHILSELYFLLAAPKAPRYGMVWAVWKFSGKNIFFQWYYRNTLL